MAFQSIVLEIQCLCPALPVPIVARFSPQGRAGNPNCLVSLLFLASDGMRTSLFELFGLSSLLRCSSVFSSLVSDLKLYPSSWSSVYIAALQQIILNAAVPFSRQRCVVRIFLRLPRTWVLSVLLVQLDLLRHWNESTDCKDVSTSIRRSSMGILRDGEMDCAGCPQCGVHLAQKSELSSHQISLQPQLRTKIRAELSSNLYSRELRTAGLTPHFHDELL